MEYKDLIFKENGEVVMPPLSSPSSDTEESFVSYEEYPDLKYVKLDSNFFILFLFLVFYHILSHPYFYGFLLGFIILLFFRFVL